MAARKPESVRWSRLKATKQPKAERKPKAPRPPKLKAERPPKAPRAPRTPKPKLTPIERAALAIADPEAREAAGRALWAELEAHKQKLIAECRRIKLNPHWDVHEARDLSERIEAQTARQNEVFFAYASEARLVAWEDGREQRWKTYRAAYEAWNAASWANFNRSERRNIAPLTLPPRPPVERVRPDPLRVAIDAAFRRWLGARSDAAYDKHLARFEALSAAAQAEARA
jgi:hypothetical protein